MVHTLESHAELIYRFNVLYTRASQLGLFVSAGSKKFTVSKNNILLFQTPNLDILEGYISAYSDMQDGRFND